MTPPSNPSSIYLDSTALISVLAARPGYEPVAQVLELAKHGNVTLFISAMSYVEVRGFGNDEPYPPERDKAATDLLDGPSLHQIEFSRGVALQARKIAYTYHLKNPDAIHVASAVTAEAEVMFTSDRQLQARGRIGGVYIAEPYEIGESFLFSC